MTPIVLFLSLSLLVITNAFININRYTNKNTNKNTNTIRNRFRLRSPHAFNEDMDLSGLYTLIWHNCVECNVLLQDMENLDLPFVYVDGGALFYDMDIENEPLLYINDELIGTNLFDIYAELYKNI